MCSVSYLPNSEGGFILTSNRDESIHRQSLSPQKYLYKETEMIFPKDSQVFGSWIACSAHSAVCLLNGAREAHHHQPPYKMSRGVVLLDLLSEKDIHSFREKYYLVDIEPFTVIYVDILNIKLYELVWDGKYADLSELDPTQAYFWSSSTLYNHEWRIRRKKWFMDFIQDQPILKPQDAFNFHSHAGNGNDEYDLVMSRKGGELRTISITQIIHPKICTMLYRDLLSQKETVISF